MNPIIEIKNLSKKYNIYLMKEGMTYSTIRDELTDIVRKPIRWLKGERENREVLWALKDVSFNINPGEIIGIIGPNGAGKSTLLKLLTRITPPSEGEAIIRGRVGSLLEVGTGFHPELTGRENIYLNGAILGMTTKEIEQKFDRIVEFAGIKKFLDTPAKRYSSGMYVRLAFSVAVHLEPDILLVDEVLSVGDAAFQKKSFDKMQEITRKGDRTVILVSHNMGAIEKLCKKCILLENGGVKMIGETKDVIEKHLSDSAGTLKLSVTRDRERRSSGDFRFTKIVFQDENGLNIEKIYSGQNIKMLLYYNSREDVKELTNVKINVKLTGPLGEKITTFYSGAHDVQFGSVPKKGHFVINIPNFPLVPGTYSFTYYAKANNHTADWIINAGHIRVEGDKFFPHGESMPEDQSVFYIKHNWSVKED